MTFSSKVSIDLRMLPAISPFVSCHGSGKKAPRRNQKRLGLRGIRKLLATAAAAISASATVVAVTAVAAAAAAQNED